jgi:PilZ domain
VLATCSGRMPCRNVAIAYARMLRAGKIVFNNKSSVIDCMVRNLSRTGACLLVPNVIGVPTTFELLIEGEGASRPCKMIWNNQNRIGIEFRG